MSTGEKKNGVEEVVCGVENEENNENLLKTAINLTNQLSYADRRLLLDHLQVGGSFLTSVRARSANFFLFLLRN